MTPPVPTPSTTRPPETCLQRRELLGGPHRVAQGEHHHAEPDVDALGDGGRGREHDRALRIGAGRLEVVAHEDAVEAELLRVSGLLARARRRSVGAGLQHHRDLQPAAHRGNASRRDDRRPAVKGKASRFEGLRSPA
jgi:hypothetical protein